MKRTFVDFDCLIVGAGVIGTTMATLLRALRLVERGRVAVISEHLHESVIVSGTGDASADWDLRVFALSRASQRLLEICGIWSALPSRKRYAYERMTVWDARGHAHGDGSLTFDCAELGEPNLGTIVEGRALQSECVRAANAAGVSLIEAGIRSAQTDEDGVRIELLDGRELRTHLLMAADGTESRTRALLGIDTAGHDYQQDALVAHVSTTMPHGDTAWQRFMPTGPLAFLPLPEGRSSIVWSTQRAEATRLRALDKVEFGKALTAASDGVLGTCELSTALATFPLKLQYATHYVQPRAVLLGDAAHVVHPLAGQGLNLGLLDCAALASVLGDSSANAAFGEYRQLRRYERWRRSENLLAATALDALERLFGNDNPALSRLRIMGMNGVGRIPMVKRILAGRALGLSGDVPAFLMKNPLAS